MRVLLIEAPYHDLYTQRDNVSFRRYFPLGIGYVAAMLRQGGFQPDLFIQPFKADFKQALAAKLQEFQPDVVGGGGHTPSSGQEVLMESPEIDYVIYGEGEQITLALCRHLAPRPPATPD